MTAYLCNNVMINSIMFFNENGVGFVDRHSFKRLSSLMQ